MGGATFERVAAWLRDAKPELVGALQKMRARIEAEVEEPTRKRRRVRRRLEDGEELDPQAWVERRTDGWSDIESTRSPRHLVSVAVNAAVNSNRRPEDLLWRGAAACAVADVLTSRGYSVAVDLVVAVNNPANEVDGLMFTVPVKPADSPLDVGTVATSLADIGFFRLVCINLIGQCSPGKVTPGFGRAATIARLSGVRYDVLLDADVFSEDGAVAAAVAACKFDSSKETSNV